MKKLFAIISILISVILLYLVLRPSNFQELEMLKKDYASETSAFFKFNNYEYHYTQKGQGVPLIFIHGLAGNAFLWDTLINKIDSGYQCIALDLPGFGLSDLDLKHAEKDLSNYFLEVFKALLVEKGIDSFHLLGSSMGGYISMDLAVKLQDRTQSLTLSNPLCYDVKKAGGVFAQLAQGVLFKLIESKGLPLWISKIIYSNTTVEQIAEKDIRIRNVLNNKKITFDFIKLLFKNRNIVKNDLAKKVSVPTMIIWGNKDKIISPTYAERLERDIENSKSIMYKDIGHLSFYENVDQFKIDMMSLITTLPDSNHHSLN